MPIPAPGTYDVASQLSLLAVKAKTDLLLFANMYTARLADVDGRAALAAATWLSVAIQPPAGETWVVFIQASVRGAVGVTDMHCSISYFDGGTEYGGVSSHEAPIVAHTNARAGCLAVMRLTNAHYVLLLFYVAGAATVYEYAYFGYKE